MPQHFLNRVDIGAVFQQVCRKGMPKRMGRDIFVDFRLFLIVLNEFPKALPLHTLTADVDEQRLFIGHSDHLWTNKFEIIG